MYFQQKFSNFGSVFLANSKNGLPVAIPNQFMLQAFDELVPGGLAANVVISPTQTCVLIWQ